MEITVLTNLSNLPEWQGGRMAIPPFYFVWLTVWSAVFLWWYLRSEHPKRYRLMFVLLLYVLGAVTFGMVVYYLLLVQGTLWTWQK